VTRVHLIEPADRGGVHQHTVALGNALVTAGVDVTFWTAADPEELGGSAPERPLVWFFPALRPRRLRQAAAAVSYVLLGLPRCVASIRRGDVVHFQGRLAAGLAPPLVVAARLRRCVVAFTPHTTFARPGQPTRERRVRWLARRADVTFVSTEESRRAVVAWGARPQSAGFPVLAPTPSAELVESWRARWRRNGTRRTVLFAGQIREDKGLDVLVRAAAQWGDDLAMAVVGEDVGAADHARRLAAELDVEVSWAVGYVPFADFVAAVAAADVVACPYRAPGQSAVLALAHALGRPTVATSVVGLGELGTVIVPPDDPTALADGARRAAEARTTPAPTLGAVGRDYLQAYNAAVRGET
jgi:glycosyltransferase involved in cell wall biosynthesis